LTAAVSQLNQDSAQVASINSQIRSNAGGRNDAGLQAQLYTTLQDMSTLAPVSVHIESDGTATVLLGGQAPLVMGTTQNNVVANLNYTPAQPVPAPVPAVTEPTTVQLTVAGQDVTSLVNQGTLGGALGFANTTMAAILGNGPQQGSLNQLAQSVADTVNGLLTSGVSSAGSAGPPIVPPVPGVALFSYGALATPPATGPLNPTTVAASLTVTNITGSQLAAITPAVAAVVGPPAVAAVAFSANGVAAQLAALANSTGANGFTLTQTYGAIATNVGQQTSTATANATADTNLLNQATTLRASLSGVSLNNQATQLLQFQESYQASAQMITTISTLAQDLLTASAAWVSSAG
jgi:flagellar hook-associated protein 1 FlgK